MTYRELYNSLKGKVGKKASVHIPLEKKIAEAKGFADLKEFLAYIKAEGEWLTAERVFLRYETQIEANGVDLDKKIDVKNLYPYIDVKV